MLDRNIFVIGYPKSGNTWLTRLLARTIHLPVSKYTVDDIHPEMAADINDDLSNLDLSNSKIYKLHFLPQTFEKWKENREGYIFYIHREPKDALISAFFYSSGYQDNPKYVRRHPEIIWFIKPKEVMKWISGRIQLYRFLFKELFVGSYGLGTAQDHISEWRKYINANSKTSIEISYEDLYKDPVGTLISSLEKLTISVDREEVQKFVALESFDVRKKEVSVSNRELTFGRDFNLRFLRSGKLGDWVNYLSLLQQLIFFIHKLSQSQKTSHEKY